MDSLKKKNTQNNPKTRRKRNKMDTTDRKKAKIADLNPIISIQLYN